MQELLAGSYRLVADVMEHHRQPAAAVRCRRVDEGLEVISVIGLAPSTAMVRIAIGSFAGSVSINGAVGVVFDVETPPP